MTLRRNKLRSFLTMLGVSWGIFMLVVMLGMGNGLKNAVLGGFDGFATNCSFIWTMPTTKPYEGFQRGRRFNFDNDDTRTIRDQVPGIRGTPRSMAQPIEPMSGDESKVLHTLYCSTGAPSRASAASAGARCWRIHAGSRPRAGLARVGSLAPNMPMPWISPRTSALRTEALLGKKRSSSASINGRPPK